MTTLLGWYLNVRAKANENINSFFAAKKELGAVLICFTMFGEMVAGSSTVGSATTAFGSGMSSVWVNWGQVLGVFLFIPTVAKFYRAAGHYGAYSVPEAFAFRFGDRTRSVVLVIIIVVYGIVFAMQPKAAGAIIAPMLGIDLKVAVWAMGIIFIIQAFVGLKGIAAMNVVHSSVLYIGALVVAVLAYFKTGGLACVREAVAPEFFNFAQPSLSSTLGTALGTMFAFLLSTSLVANMYGARSTRAASRGVLSAALLVAIFALFPAFIGVAGRIMLPDAASATIFYTVADYFGTLTGGVASMAVIAAVFSSAPAVILTVCTSITRDFYKKYINKDADDKQQLRFTRLAIVVLGLLCTYLGMNATSILSSISGAFQIRAVAGMLLVIGVHWKKVDNNSAFWAMLVGGLTAAIWHFTGQPLGIAPFWPGCGVALLIVVVMSLLNGQAVSTDYLAYREKYDAAMAEQKMEQTLDEKHIAACKACPDPASE